MRFYINLEEIPEFIEAKSYEEAEKKVISEISILSEEDGDFN